ncbi:hypothetical protein [uncultured Tateyamaria sp.]|uniref:hypothetical protein n=1 Tax=Tateyamaria sp. 1078 TaxID=3417464 RepID=UPI002615BCA9|nr:hypothetical protein [uncultured Tateyamaria sp.]
MLRNLEHRLVWTALVVVTVYGLYRVQALFPLVGADDRVLHFYDLDAFLAAYPSGILGIIPSRVCSLSAAMCDVPRDIEVGKLADPMLSSGYFVCFLGLWLSMWVEGLYRAMSTQLRAEGVLHWTDADDAVIEHRRMMFSRVTALCVVVMVFPGTVFLHFQGWPTEPAAHEMLWSMTFLGALAGHRLGTIAALGTFGRRLNRSGGQLRLVLGHSDGAGGARRVGEFLAFQGILVSLPITWLSFWLAMVWSVPEVRAFYGQWWPLHLGLLIVAMVIAWYGLISPFYTFIGHYRASKREVVAAWRAKTVGTLSDLQSVFHNSDNWRDAKSAIEESEALTAVSSRISSMSSVPLRASVRGLFSITSLFPLFTLGLEILVPNEKGFVSLMSQVMNLFGRVLG